MAKRNKKIYVLIGLIIAIVVVSIIFKNNQSESREPEFEPLVQYGKGLEAYYEKCPLSRYDFEIKGEWFEGQGVKCSENLDYNLAQKGEEALIYIVSQDEEIGKNEFKSWLKTHNLEENSRLRVTYQNKPR